MVEFGTLVACDEFTFDQTLFVVLIANDNGFGLAMSTMGRRIKFHSRDMVKK